MNATHDLVVIGSGPGGYRAAVLGALRGLDVAIVERAEWGGCCLNRGCVPKKTWHHTARLLAEQSAFPLRGVSGRLRGDLSQAWRHQRNVVGKIRDSYSNYLQRLGVSRLVGHAHLLAANRVEIRAPGGIQRVNARHVIIATGSTPTIPQTLELVPGKVVTTDMLFEQPAPKGQRVAILGSGVAATELAFILAMFCREVTWVGRSPSLRRQPFSAPAKRALAEALDRRGVHLRMGASPVSIEDRSAEGLVVALDDGTTVGADWICVAMGRRPMSHSMGLEEVGVETDVDGFVVRDAYLESSMSGVYAIGDCASREMSANHALANASLVVDNIVHGNRRPDDPTAIPTVVYSALEMGRIGHDEDSAEDAGLEPAIGFAAFDHNPCAAGLDKGEGFVRILADLDSGRLLGGEVVGYGAAELINILSLAPDRDTALSWIAAGRYNHPTMAEELLNATETLAQKWGLGATVFGD